MLTFNNLYFFNQIMQIIIKYIWHIGFICEVFLKKYSSSFNKNKTCLMQFLWHNEDSSDVRLL